MTKKVLLALGLAVLVGVVGLALIDFDSEELGRAVLDRASESTGLTMTAERFRLNLLSGLRIENLEVRGVLAGGGQLQVQLEGLVLEHRLLPLLRRTLAVNKVVLDSPHVQVTPMPGGVARRSPPGAQSGAKSSSAPSGEPAGSASSKTDASTSLPVAIEVEHIELVAGRFQADRAKKSSTTVEGIEMKLAGVALRRGGLTPIHGLEARGVLSASRVALDDSELTGFDGRIEMAGGRWSFSDVAFATPEGKFRAKLDVDFNQTPFRYTLDLEGDPLDANAVVGSGRGFGRGRLDFDGEGFGSESRRLAGQGVLKLEEGTLPEIPLLKALERSLGRTALVGAEYQSTEARFRLAKDRLTLDPFDFETAQAGLTLSGWADLGGQLSINLTVRTPREGLKIKEVQDEVLDALTDERGWVALPFRVAGTVGDPSVRPDGQALLAQAQKGARRVVEEKAKEGIGSFLRKKLGRDPK